MYVTSSVLNTWTALIFTSLGIMSRELLHEALAVDMANKPNFMKTDEFTEVRNHQTREYGLLPRLPEGERTLHYV